MPKEAFPTTYREEDGEIVPSYAPGNGNAPTYHKVNKDAEHQPCNNVVDLEEVEASNIAPLQPRADDEGSRDDGLNQVFAPPAPGNEEIYKRGIAQAKEQL